MKQQTLFKTPAKYIVFKRWDAMEVNEKPLVIIFFAPRMSFQVSYFSNYDETEYN